MRGGSALTFVLVIFDGSSIIIKKITISKNNNNEFSAEIEEGTGGTDPSLINEHVVLTISSNQGVGDASTLNGVSVNINNTPYTWGGTPIQVDIPSGTEYNITFSEIEGYTKPQDQMNLTAIGGETRIVTAEYNTCLTTINIISNQSNPDSNLYGIQARVEYDNHSENLTYNGFALTCKIPTGSSYTITPSSGADTGYSTPSVSSEVAEGINQIVNLNYNTTVITVTHSITNKGTGNLSGSFDNDFNWNVVYGDTTKGFTSSSQTDINVPTGVEFTINPDSSTNYTSSPVSDTATGTSMNKELTYTFNMEDVTVTYTGFNGNWTDKNEMTVELLVNSSQVSTCKMSQLSSWNLNVPYGTTYTLAINDEASKGFNEVDDQTFVASQESRTVTFSLSKIAHEFTITINRSQSDPSVQVDGDPSYLLNQFRRCLCSPNSSGGVDISYLRDDNSNYYEDGTTSILTGAEGDVMVYFPEMWYWGETTSTQHVFHIADAEVAGYHHAPASLVGAYKACLSGDGTELHSWSNKNAVTGTSIEVLYNRATITGTGYHLIDYQQHCIIGWMFMARYGTRNSQAICGTGGERLNDKTGVSDSFGMSDSTTGAYGHVQFLGLEDCWGNCHEYMEGIHSYSSDGIIAYDKGYYIDQNYSNMVSNTKRILIPAGSSSGLSYSYISDIIGGEYCDLLPNKGNGSGSTYYCDYCYIDDFMTAVFSRSEMGTGDEPGVFVMINDNNSSGTGSYTSSRLAYDGSITSMTPTEYITAHGSSTRNAITMSIENVSDPSSITVTEGGGRR